MDDALFSVKDQVVLVSGGTRGIGRAIAEGFAARGARVIITGREQESAERAAREMSIRDGAVRGMACDVTDISTFDPLIDALMSEFDRIDVLVNAAGVNRRLPAEKFTVDDFDFVLDTNLKGAFFLSQAVGRHMLAQGAGVQINIGSLNNQRPLLNVAPYAMSKAGLGQMTQALASEWGPRGVRVNMIAPGFILTDLTRKLWSDAGMRAWGEGNTPLGRLGQPEDMIGAAVFLASPAAAFLTGQILYVDGGFTSAIRWPIPE